MKIVFRALVFALSFVMFSASSAESLTIPNTFTSGTTAIASEVNENFTAIANAMPAVKTVTTTRTTEITVALVDIVSLTVTPPDDGFIILTGSSYVGVNQTVAANNYAFVYLTTISRGTSGTLTFFRLDTQGGSADASWAPLSLTGVFPVTGGVATTFFMTAERDNFGANSVFVGFDHASLTAIFVPNQLP
jgi:hypothetical protein